MYFVIKLCVVLYLIHFMDFIDADNLCKVPNGKAGTCIRIANCPPMRNLYKKKHKTGNEKKFIRQAMCGPWGSEQISVCCPPQSEWSDFLPTPVAVPPSTVYRNPDPILSVIKPNVLTIPSQATNRVNEPKLPTPDTEDYSDICGIDTSSGNRITSGDVTAVDQYPWLVLLEFANGFLGCGGSLISSRYVLTAAHCIRSVHGTPLFALLGEYNTSTYPTDIVDIDGGGVEEVNVTRTAVRSTHYHSSFNRAAKVHDIGLVELEDPAQFSDFIKVICLPSQNLIPAFNSSTFFYVAGWGSDGVLPGTQVKMDTTVPYKPLGQCPLLDHVSPSAPALQICAGGEGGRDSCLGDSGGPLMYESEDHIYIAVGIVSYGDTCGKEGQPAVHTYVYPYLDWIRNILSGKIDQ